MATMQVNIDQEDHLIEILVEANEPADLEAAQELFMEISQISGMGGCYFLPAHELATHHEILILE
jgi:hypothetical protein